MDEQPQTVSLRYYGISPWEIEVSTTYSMENLVLFRKKQNKTKKVLLVH